MSNLVMWSLIVGFVMPNVVALIQQPRFSNTVRSLITAAVSVVGGFLTAYFNDQLNFADVTGAILVTGVAAITFYKGFWKPTGVAVAIENATSKTPPTVEQAHPEGAPHDPVPDTDGYLGQHARNERGAGEFDLLIKVIALVILVVLVVWLVSALLPA